MSNQQIWGTVLSALGTALLSVGGALLANNVISNNSTNSEGANE
jgi:hypothetical protein